MVDIIGRYAGNVANEQAIKKLMQQAINKKVIQLLAINTPRLLGLGTISAIFGTAFLVKSAIALNLMRYMQRAGSLARYGTPLSMPKQDISFPLLRYMRKIRVQPAPSPTTKKAPAPHPDPIKQKPKTSEDNKDKPDDNDERIVTLIHGDTRRGAQEIVDEKKGFQGITSFVLGRADRELAVGFAHRKSRKYPKQGGPELVVIQIYESDLKRFQRMGLIRKRPFDANDDPELRGKIQYILGSPATKPFNRLVLEWKREPVN